MQPCGKCISRASCIRTRLADENHACANKGASYSSCSVASETKREAQEPRACTFCCTKMFPSFPLAPFTSLRSFPCLRFDRFAASEIASTCFVFATVSRSIYASLRSISRGYVGIKILPQHPLFSAGGRASNNNLTLETKNVSTNTEIYNRREILKVNFHQPN